VLRVNNRDLNIAFYQESLGFKLISEENAIAVFSAWQNKEASFIIEESPTYRTRAVNGTKKLAKIIVKSQDAKDIEKLLANGAQAIQVYQGQNGYAYETVSPEGDLFLLHAEDDLSQLVAIERPELEKKDDTTGLSNFAFQSISLNVPDAVKAEAFYDKVFAGKFPI
ncbi:peptidase, partial [Streptococcus sp. SPC0]|nr:peptidase [Streptococcus sp. SPC0]